MKAPFDKYFANELNDREKKEFLSEVAAHKDLKEEFVEDQQLMALVAMMPRPTDEEQVRQRFSEFMSKTGKE